ncbi:sulfite exporter TauE/SafE family protein [Cytobacillus sp. OWB-43]|uniref:sulfite exporter TauE/SafE family protein n=1 Tax=Cytobacillus sp. OWB-43 TaxID=3108468 RepID=UPI002AFE9719|nr:sulfite exporter TauE/SafE family protein [Cytobacillus sp. OWB-43]MEA1852262.1 sulfite exporter TauE/SafE family protein [Cytobacillus sp. OWB-43]
MKNLLLFIFIGLFAQLIDGALGMAYGVTSTSLLLAFGIVPAVASASVHLAEVVTTAASGISHIKFGNVDKQTVFKLIIPGSIGAFLGATFLSNIPGDLAKPYIALFLLLLGVFIFIRFLFKYKESSHKSSINLSKKQSIPLGFIAGFADATGGGGWGPVTTPVLLSKKGVSPRKVVGTVDTSEFAIALSASIGFLISLGWHEVNWLWVGALMVGGVIAAPIAAWLVQKLNPQLMGVLVGGFIILINIQTIVQTWISNEEIHPIVYSAVAIIWVTAIIFTIIRIYHKKMLHLNS